MRSMKSDRLIATLLLLQARGRVTAADLAGSNETSVATARRDLEALSAAGVPVYPQPGRGGGWQLVGGARTDLSGLTAGEAQALFLLLGTAVTSRPEARSALAKLLQALPATFRQDAATAAGAVVVDPTRWGFERAEADQADQASGDLLRRLQHAAVAGDVVQLEYRRRDGAESVRDVDPLGFVDKDGRWYLVADGEHGRRTYRLDRIIAAVTTDRTFVRPDVDLQAEWAAIVGRVEHQRAAVHATVRTTLPVALVLHTQFGAAYEELGMQGETVTLRLGAHLPAALVEQLAGWGDRVEVVEPPEVRAGLARTGAALVALYRTESPCSQRL